MKRKNTMTKKSDKTKHATQKIKEVFHPKPEAIKRLAPEPAPPTPPPPPTVPEHVQADADQTIKTLEAEIASKQAALQSLKGTL